MSKKGGMRWQKRWFVLAQAGGRAATLEYFREPNDAAGARATLELTSDTKVDLLPGKMYGLQVIMNGRALKVHCDSDKDREDWMRALRKVIAEAIQQQVVHFAGTDWSINPKYKLQKKVGSGAYGFVCSADDVSAKPPKAVAIKKVAKAFEDMVDAKRILREIRLMRQFDHPNVVRLYDVEEPPYIEDFEDLYIVSELMSTDLQKILYSKTKLTGEQLQYLLYQLVCAVHYINSCNVLHRDLKPSNLLIDIQTCHLQVCDFGLARGVSNPDELKDDAAGEAVSGEMTEYVVTRWYRAPEIMLGYHSYTMAIDMWSVGCIFGEMLLSQPVFPGNDYIHQLKLIVKMLGKAPKDDLWFVSNPNALNFMTQLPDYKPQPLAERFPGAPPAALELLGRMLKINPTRRISLADAMAHPYVEEFREDALERPAGFGVEMADVEEVKLTKKNLQRMMYEEVRAFHRQQAAAAAGPAGEDDSKMPDDEMPEARVLDRPTTL